MIAMIRSSDQPCWLAEACEICILLLLQHVTELQQHSTIAVTPFF